MENTIQIHVQLYSAPQTMKDWEKQAVRLPEASTVEDVFQVLSQADSSLKSLLLGEEHSLSALVMVNSKDIKRKKGLDTVLSEGDKVDIVFMITGG